MSASAASLDQVNESSTEEKDNTEDLLFFLLLTTRSRMYDGCLTYPTSV